MAEEKEENAQAAGGGGGGGAPCEEPKPCPPCPEGLPGWLATFSDLCTLLLTFFILLLSFAKTETAKNEAALGSVRNAFGGNSLKQGEVSMKGKSPYDSFTMLESQFMIQPFPIDFLTMEGLLDKNEINRESTEELANMRSDLENYSLQEHVTIEEVGEGIKVRLKENIYFKEGTIEIENFHAETMAKLADLMKNENWVLFIEGHSSVGEKSKDGKLDAWGLSSLRSMVVSQNLLKRGIKADRINPVFYGDSRPDRQDKSTSRQSDPRLDQRVEFMLRKTDLRTPGHFVSPHP